MKESSSASLHFFSSHSQMSSPVILGHVRSRNPILNLFVSESYQYILLEQFSSELMRSSQRETGDCQSWHKVNGGRILLRTEEIRT